MRRVTKTRARFHVTDFWGGSVRSKAGFSSHGLLGLLEICAGPSPCMVHERGTLSENGLWIPAPPPTHTHPYLAGCFALTESPLDCGWQTRTGLGAVAGSHWVPSPPEPCSPARLSWD